MITADTNIYISAFNFSGKPRQFIEAAAAGEFDLAISAAIRREVIRVLHDKFHWNMEKLGEAEQDIASFTHLVKPGVRLSVIKEDPADDRVLECAVASGSDIIVTGDNDLLRLKEYEGIRMMKVAEFLRMGRRR